MAKLPRIALLEKYSDLRTGRQRKTVIFSPVGDAGQLREFCRHVKKLEIDKEADFLFVCKKGLRMPRLPLSEAHAFEALPLGTSGSFFAGQYLAYLMGYEVIVIADLDAFLDSRKTFLEMVALARGKGCAVAPLSKDPSEKAPARGYFVINQWGTVPRNVFEEAGFAMPYTYKGAEDYEFLSRLRHRGRFIGFEGGFAIHPKKGLNIYYKMANSAKYYPYLAGLMKAYLFGASYSRMMLLRYLSWYSYHSFFSDVFGDMQLKAVLQRPFHLNPHEAFSGNIRFSVQPLSRKEEAGPKPRLLLAFMPLISLLFFRKADFHDERVVLSIPRPALFFRLLSSLLLVPVRFAQGLLASRENINEASHFPFPIMPGNAGAAMRLYISYISKEMPAQ